MISELKIGKLYAVKIDRLHWFKESWDSKNMVNTPIILKMGDIVMLTSIISMKTQILTSWVTPYGYAYTEIRELPYHFLDLIE